MSAVSAAVSAAVPARARRLGAQGRRPFSALRRAAAGGARRGPPPAAPVAFDPAPALLAAAGLAAFAALCLPELRTELAIGWLPLWLVAAPLAAWAGLCLARARDRRDALLPVVRDRPRPAGRRALRGAAQAVRRRQGEGVRAVLRQAA